MMQTGATDGRIRSRVHWDFGEEARRISPIAPGTAIGEARFAELTNACRHLDTLEHAAEKLIALTIPA